MISVIQWRRRATLDFRLGLNRVLFGLCAVILFFQACTKEPPRVVVDRILINVSPLLEQRGLNKNELRTALGVHLRQDPSCVFGSGQTATHLLRVTMDLAPTSRASAPVYELAAWLQPIGDQVEFSAKTLLSPATSVLQSVMQGFTQVWLAIGQQRRLDRGNGKGLIGGLSHSDLQLRAFAMRRLGQRRQSSAVVPLIKALKTEAQHELVLRAVGALVEIGDIKAVEPLIDLTHQKDPAFVLQIIYAVAALGGPTAEAYLVTLASGHPDPGIQQGAKEALEDLHKKKTPPRP